MNTSNNFYVYKHVNNKTNKTFYIGKGIKSRYKTKFYRNKYWHNIVNKYNYTPYIIKSNLTENEANILEHKLILLYKRYGRAEANLNLDFGIGGRLGRTDNDYKLNGIKVSQKVKGTREGSNNANFGNIYSEETKDKISKSLIGKLKGISQTKTHIYNRTFHSRKKIINCMTKEIYDSVDDLSKILKKSKTYLRNQLNNTVINKTGFKYLEDYDENTL